MEILTEQLDLGRGPQRIVVKDTIDIAGYPTRAGSAALNDAPMAQRHADIVERALTAGYRVVGKANLHELAFGMTGINGWSGTPVNPNFPELIPGGSSSGSAAAVAAELAEIGIGTDTGGSIRVPAACCGVYGLKPTFGRLSRRGVMPARSSLDCVGPITADLEVLIAFMEAMDTEFRLTIHTPLRLGRVEANAEPSIIKALDTCLDGASLSTHASTLPRMAEAYEAAMVVISHETYLACATWLDSGRLGADVERRLRAAGNTTVAELHEAEAIRRAFTTDVDRLLETCDVLVLPTLPHYPLSRADAEAGQQDLTISTLVRPFNLSGHPALTLPLPPHDGKPVGLQLIGRHGDDAGVCRAARSLAISPRPGATNQTIGEAHAQLGR